MDPTIGKVLYGILVISLIGDLISIVFAGINSPSIGIAELVLILIVIGLAILIYDVRREAKEEKGFEEEYPPED
ncbi:MAG: hypothetical protein JZD40_01850 [Sulfolobus sp.]|nr:hypothetical protein [Sulfolobus sp.]